MHSAINSDIEIWLNNKLEGAWSSEKISSSLTPSTLEAAKTRFSFLDTSIKLKLLFSFVTLGKRLREDLDEHVKEILITASEDDDEWVEVISKLFATLMTQEGDTADGGETATNDTKPSASDGFQMENEHFGTLQKHLKESLREHGPPRFWPLEYPYVNTNIANLPALESNFANPHFKLKTKLEEPSLPSTPKRPPQTMPTMSSSDKKRRGLSESQGSPMGLNSNRKRPSPLGSQLSRSFDAGLEKKEQAKKKLRVLDIQEVQAIHLQQNRLLAEEEEEEKLRKKKERTEAAEAKRQEREERKMKRKEERDARKKMKEEMKQEKEAKRQDKKRQQQIAKAEKKISFPTRPSLGPLGDESPATLLGRTVPIEGKTMPMGLPQGLYQTIQPRGNMAPQQGAGMLPFKYNTAPSPMMAATGRSSSLLSQALLPQGAFSSQPFSQSSQTSAPQTHTWSSYVSPLNPSAPMGAATTTTTAPPPPPPQSSLPSNLFDQANCLTETNKQILVNFLSGQVMQNPTPASGPVKQILLNEEEKMNTENSGKYLEQIIFEINYNTGSWRKLRRKKMITPDHPPQQASSQAYPSPQHHHHQQQQQQHQQQPAPQPPILPPLQHIPPPHHSSPQQESMMHTPQSLPSLSSQAFNLPPLASPSQQPSHPQMQLNALLHPSAQEN